jgi:hypothetical protein
MWSFLVAVSRETYTELATTLSSLISSPTRKCDGLKTKAPRGRILMMVNS